MTQSFLPHTHEHKTLKSSNLNTKQPIFPPPNTPDSPYQAQLLWLGRRGQLRQPLLPWVSHTTRLQLCTTPAAPAATRVGKAGSSCCCHPPERVWVQQRQEQPLSLSWVCAAPLSLHSARAQKTKLVKLIWVFVLWASVKSPTLSPEHAGISGAHTRVK